MTRHTLRLALASLLVLSGLRAAAQDGGYTFLSYVGPDVSLVSDNDEDTSARPNTPISAGDRLSTGSASRAEAILSDGTVVRFDARTDARFERLARTWQAEDDRNLIALTNGALALETRRAVDEERATRIDTDDATVIVAQRALVRVDAGRRGTEVYVVSGSAQVLARAGREVVRAGESAIVSGEEPIEVVESDLPRDRFTQFLEERRPARRSESAQRLAALRAEDDYLVEEASWDDESWDYAASSLDDYGSWVYVSGYSRWCWRPRVAVDWRPYSLGSWRYTPAGLTWVSYEPWGWTPYHYGSWFLDTSFGWCWSPGWSYSPAWVYWNYTPSWVGWCPIGYYGGYNAWSSWYGGSWGHHGRWESRYPHLRGRVDVTRIDPRGWNYVSATRIGTRFDRTDIVRGDRVPFRRGEVGVVSTAPLRIESTRGGVRNAVVEAVRRVQVEAIPGRGGAAATDAGLTQILRRERELSPEARETLRRSVVPVGRDTLYRPVPAQQIASGRIEPAPVTRGGGVRDVRTESPASTRGPARGGADRVESWRGGVRSETRVDRGGSESRGPSRSADGWRTTEGGNRFRRDDAPMTRGESPARQGTVREGTVRESAREGGRTRDSGWRSAPVGESPRREAPTVRPEGTVRSETPSRTRDDGWRAPAPRTGSERRESRSYEPPRAYDVPSRRDRGDESFRSPAPRHESRSFERREPSRSYEAPRSYAPPSRSYEAPARREPPSRSYEAPRSYAPPSRSYEAPARREPPARSVETPRSYAPPSRSYEAPARREPPARSYEAPRPAPPPRSEPGPGRREGRG